MFKPYQNASIGHIAANFAISAGAQNPTSSAAHNIVSEDDFKVATAQISGWAGYEATPLHHLDSLAGKLKLGAIYYKDESSRFGLGSFKALGAAYACLRLLQRKLSAQLGIEVNMQDVANGVYKSLIREITVVAATDGNHGASLAWGARNFGAPCRIYIHSQVSQGREQAIAKHGAEIIRVDGDYDYSLQICREEAEENDWFIISDTSWENYTKRPTDVMAGYGVMIREINQQLQKNSPDTASNAPTHVFVQGGVGGLAAAVGAALRQFWRQHCPRMIIVEPELAPCLFVSAKNGRATKVQILEETMMAGLSCGEPSMLAWQILQEEADDFLIIPETLVAPSVRLLGRPLQNDPPIIAGESAIAGLAALIGACMHLELKTALGLNENSRILLIGSEGATDPKIYSEIMNS